MGAGPLRIIGAGDSSSETTPELGAIVLNAGSMVVAVVIDSEELFPLQDLKIGSKIKVITVKTTIRRR